MSARPVLIVALIVFALGGGAVHPFGRVTQESTSPVLDGSVIDTANLQRIQRSCANCHSAHVHWPWYSYVAPASWFVENDVNQARSRMNLSRWSSYSTQERITLLSAIGAALRVHAMPPRRYTALHREASLTDAERSALYEWAKSERHRLRTLAPGK